MAIIKSRLTSSESKRYQECLRQLYEEGVDVREEIENPERGREACPVQIMQGSSVGIMCDDGNVVYYIMPIRIVARQQTVIEDYRVETSWDSQTIELPCLNTGGEHYNLGQSGLSFPVRDVLNDYLDSTFAIKRDAILDGAVLAYGLVPIPAEITGRVVPVRLTLVDARGREAHTDIRLTARCATKDEHPLSPKTKPNMPRADTPVEKPEMEEKSPGPSASKERQLF